MPRRILRKGTFSCWECKRRKKRCEFPALSDSVCSFCERHDLQCVSQAFSEHSDDEYAKVQTHIAHVERLVDRLLLERKSQTLNDVHSAIGQTGVTHDACSDALAPLAYMSPQSFVPMLNSDSLLKSHLHSLLPDPTLAMWIIVQGQIPYEILPGQKFLSAAAHGDSSLSLKPSPTSHPVVFARRLMELAFALKQMNVPEMQQLLIAQGGSTPWYMARRYVDEVHRVTCQDILVRSVEGLEACLLEALYYVDQGDFGKGQLLVRRAMNTARLTGVSYATAYEDARAARLWFRMIYADCHLSLVTGSCCAVEYRDLAIEPPRTMSSICDWINAFHVKIASRISTRNARIQRRLVNERITNVMDHEIEETKTLDHQLQQAAGLLPLRWWMLPRLEVSFSEADIKLETARLMAQLHQFYLLALVHQPYLFTERLAQNPESSPAAQQEPHGYSSVVISGAGREALSRTVSLPRIPHNPLSHAALMHKAFIAATVLLLSHINAHWLGHDNPLKHQRIHDIGLVQTFLEAYNDDSEVTLIPSSARELDSLKKLVEIEDNAAAGYRYSACLRSSSTNDAGSTTTRERSALCLNIAFFGAVHLVHHGWSNDRGTLILDTNDP